MKSHPCPATGKTTGACKGYVIDHVVPLKRGGADAPANMQWQTTAAAKAKDKMASRDGTVDGGYNRGMPPVRLTIIIPLDQAASLNPLEHFREEADADSASSLCAALPR